MLISGNSTDLCKSVEFFLQRENSPDLSTLFQEVAVEKPVENVDNSQVLPVLGTFLLQLCQLIFLFMSFSQEYICFLCE